MKTTLFRSALLGTTALLFLAGTLTSCRSGHKMPYEEILQEMYNCHTNNGPLDSAAIASHLVGTHEWRYVASWGWGGPFESQDAFAGYEIEFRDNGSYTMNFGDTSTATGQWSISPSWATYRLEMDPPCPTLHGEVYCCPPFTSFISSPVDGADYLYEKR